VAWDHPDVIVVGAGIIGSSIAWRLAQAGANVRLVEAGVFGAEASSAGAGMLAPSGEFEGQTPLAKLAQESQRLYPEYVRELDRETGAKIDFSICGSLDLAPGAAERAGRQSKAGIRSEVTEQGVLYPDDGFVDPGDILNALRRAIDGRHVELREHCRLANIDALEAGALVIAAGAWSSEIGVVHAGRLLALPKALLEPGSLPRILRHGHTYILQRTNGFTVAGSTEERIGFDRAVDEGLCREIEQRASELWTHLRGKTPVRRWVGFRPATENMELQMGRLEGTNVWLAYGHFRNGILLAPFTARQISGEIISSLGKG
jgi:glycine oxidase